MKKFIVDLGVMLGNEKLIPLYCDNNEAIAQVKEPKSHQKSNHILKRFYLIREIVARGDVVVERVPSEINIANPLTKLLSQIIFEHHKDLIGIRYIGDML